MKSPCQDFKSTSLSDDTETETRNIGLKVETGTETETECKEFVKIHGLNKGIQWKLVISSDLCRNKHKSTDIPFNILTVNLQD